MEAKELNEQKLSKKCERLLARVERDKVKNKAKNDKIAIKCEKFKQKRIKKFWRKIKVSKNDTREQIDQKIINFVSKLNPNYEYYWKIAFTDEQWNDAKFLINVYRTNPTLTNSKPINGDSELQNNLDFMFEYVKLSYNTIVDGFTKENNSTDWESYHLKSILKKYPIAMRNQEFVNLIAYEFKNVNLTEVLIDSINTSYVSFDLEAIKREKEEFKKIISNLPTDVLIREAKKYGFKMICYLPKETPNLVEIIGAGVEKDGFASLEKLDVEKVLANKHLVIKAYEVSGIRELNTYINQTLSPNRTKYYMCHGEPYDYTYFDEKYVNVQKTLKYDPEIRAIFKKEAENQKPKTITKNGVTYEYFK